MAPLRASTTKSEWLPDDPMAFAPSTPWKLPCITTWGDSQSQNHPTNSAEEAENDSDDADHHSENRRKVIGFPSEWRSPSSRNRDRHQFGIAITIVSER